MNPVEEAELLREVEHNVCTNQVISGSFTAETNSEMLEVKAVFDFTSSRPESVGLKIVGGQEETVLTYNTSSQKLVLDCTKSGKPEDGVRSVTTETNGELVLRVFIDRSSIEVFANNGQATLTSRIYPNESRTGIELFSENGDVTVKELTYWTLKDIWE